MLVNLHVKNFAIIDEIDVDLGEGLNILTGETGAGKSILIGSLNIALGGRMSPEMIGRRGESATVEAVFDIHDERIREKLSTLDIDTEDNELVISRKITATRSINKINGSSVAVGLIKQVAGLLIDIHGQNEHQSLLKPDRQRDVLDRFAGVVDQNKLSEIFGLYAEYYSLKKEIESDDLSDEEIARQLDYLRYEYQEIENARLDRAEMEEIDERYRIASNAGTVADVLSSVYSGGTKEAAELIDRVLPELKKAASMDPDISEYEEQLLNIESLIGDFNRDLSGFMQDYTFDESELRSIEQRLDLIHTLRHKYGETYDEIMEHLKETEKKIAHYSDFETIRADRRKKLDELADALREKSDELHEIRTQAANSLTDEITAALECLNFAHVEFLINVKKTDTFSAHGMDEIEFLIATNPGEPLMPLAKVASGGELSRIMLAIKSVFAESDEIGTLIFDEIDTGISGRTAQMVSEKMNEISAHHQVIAITHLSQIAAMADDHFLIEKEVNADASETIIRRLDDEESVEELARLLGGARITDAVMENAREMKRMACELKKR